MQIFCVTGWELSTVTTDNHCCITLSNTQSPDLSTTLWLFLGHHWVPVTLSQDKNNHKNINNTLVQSQLPTSLSISITRPLCNLLWLTRTAQCWLWGWAGAGWWDQCNIITDNIWYYIKFLIFNALHIKMFQLGRATKENIPGSQSSLAFPSLWSNALPFS